MHRLATNTRSSLGSELRWLPISVLVCVALLQIGLARGVGLSPWSGGGFGMFSSTDAGSTRHLHAFAHHPGFRREIALPRELATETRRALTLPTRSRLERVAHAIAEVAPAEDGPATSIEVQVWQTRFDPKSLAPVGHLLRTLDVSLPSD